MKKDLLDVLKMLSEKDNDISCMFMEKENTEEIKEFLKQKVPKEYAVDFRIIDGRYIPVLTFYPIEQTYTSSKIS